MHGVISMTSSVICRTVPLW